MALGLYSDSSYSAVRSVTGTGNDAPRSILVAVPVPSFVMIWMLVSAASQPIQTPLIIVDGSTSVGAPVTLAMPKKARLVVVATPVAGPQRPTKWNPPRPAAPPTATCSAVKRNPATAVVAAVVTRYSTLGVMVNKLVVEITVDVAVPIAVGTTAPIDVNVVAPSCGFQIEGELRVIAV